MKEDPKESSSDLTVLAATTTRTTTTVTITMDTEGDVVETEEEEAPTTVRTRLSQVSFDMTDATTKTNDEEDLELCISKTEPEQVRRPRSCKRMDSDSSSIGRIDNGGVNNNINDHIENDDNHNANDKESPPPSFLVSSLRKLNPSMVSDRAFKDLFGDDYNRKEATFVVLVGGLMALNSGVINGFCLSGFLDGGAKQNVAGTAAAITESGLALAGGDMDRYGEQISMVLCYMWGSFMASVINPFAKPYRLEPLYGPTFMIGGLCLLGSSLLSAFEAPSRYIFYLASAANGVQNGVASIYSANLIRCSMTGVVTDIALTMGQLVRGNKTQLWKGWILSIIFSLFWVGGVISFYSTHRFLSYALLFNAGLFLLIGASLVYFLVREVGVTVEAALFGTWKWKQVLGQIRTNLTDAVENDDIEEDDDGDEESKRARATVKLIQLFDRIDADGSGAIDADELLSALLEAKVKMKPYQIRTLFYTADEDNDGVISRKEWENLIFKMMDGENQKGTKSSFFRRRSRRNQ
eukprot:CAMPEP_0178861502 /NCGR_PEP_ID=MMETSP0747-20121128/2312_1 /TAXON_ID=913974 /ORGANISM="Nitzschia punctata, Strain CCMP561" /LENGTH=522 /DNA_ID=CAMNT_0020528029 /DNA_START=89 /DNA_END=1657 /DNA_ORIENTATION=-